MRKPRAFVDMDGVVVDFEGYMRFLGATAEEIKRMPASYLEMVPMAGGIEGVRSLIGMGFDVWLATKPPTGVPEAYRAKAAWVLMYLPELKRKLILTHDKGLLGDANDVLIDDHPHRANCFEFDGTLIVHTSWEKTLARCRRRMAGEHVVADVARREFMRTLFAYREMVGGLYPGIAYNRMQVLRANYAAAGGDPAELPSVPPPNEDGRPGC